MFLALAVLLAAADPSAAYKQVDRATLSGDEAHARIATAVQSLEDFAMPRSATVLLAALAADPAQSEGVRAAARERLAARASGDAALAQILVAGQGDPGKLPASLAVGDRARAPGARPPDRARGRRDRLPDPARGSCRRRR